MLRFLEIRDFVIVDRLELAFGAGFGALTGETGAGKSILLDALSLALGGRTDAGAVRAGRERAEICAGFDNPVGGAVVDWLARQGLPCDDELLLRRVIEAGGRSRAWINGSPVTLAQLRELGDFLADIHGQHAHHALLRAEAQRRLIDAIAQCEPLAARVADLFRRWRDAAEARRRAEQDAGQLARERELLEWQCSELQNLAFEPAEWAEINQEQARLAHAGSLLEGVEAAHATLVDNDAAIVPELERLSARLATLAGFDAQLAEFQDLLQSAAIQAGEAAHALGRYRDRLELDPQRLQQLDARIGEIAAAARKYRVAVEDLPELLADSLARLAALRAAGDPELLAETERECREAFMTHAGQLGILRRAAAERLGAEVSSAMQSLAMAGGRFEVALLAQPEGSAGGLEQVEFQVAASAGQPLRPLGKVASGGELSRIGLAIQVIASRDATAETLIFDEVDVGVGGRVAEIVGQMLRRLGAERQVLCVTHLPQVAAQADWQWSISKAVEAGETLSRVSVLDADGRVEEIARMLGGVEITATTRRHASEMLASRG